MTKKQQKIQVKGIEIVTFKKNERDFISLTDMAKFKSYDSGIVIANWLSTRYTVQFMGAWEKLHNPNFNLMEFNKINYKIHTDAVKDHLIPANISKNRINMVYANEADVLNQIAISQMQSLLGSSSVKRLKA